ncbi:hypothetical protein HDV02_006767 [Globomyces sp. JEL0801]|nr:hypothetical protein HDV02_006767 [Globomyces sp. JEL0801]
MNNQDELFTVFEAYGLYSGAKTAGEEHKKNSNATMTESQFKSLCHDFNLVDSNCTIEKLIECFDEAKFKRDKQINFSQFKDLLQLVSRIQFPHQSPADSYQVLCQSLTSKKVKQNKVDISKHFNVR